MLFTQRQEMKTEKLKFIVTSLRIKTKQKEQKTDEKKTKLMINMNNHLIQDFLLDPQLFSARLISSSISSSPSLHPPTI